MNNRSGEDRPSLNKDNISNRYSDESDGTINMKFSYNEKLNMKQYLKCNL